LLPAAAAGRREYGTEDGPVQEVGGEPGLPPPRAAAGEPRASFGDPTGNTSFSDRWIEDGSYVRLKQLTLNYTLPQVAGLYKGITLYVTGTNLLTFTDYSGYDPDFLYSNNPFYMGIDYGKMPQPKSFIVGLKLNL
jgi:hypothetical protein